MRASALALSFALLFPAAAAPSGALAQAQTHSMISSVEVGVSPAFERKASDLGRGEVDQMAGKLKSDLETALQKAGRWGPGGDRVELVISDLQPNHPTAAQLSRTASLTMSSPSKGGATIDGSVIAPDGSRRPVHYAWYEPSIRQAAGMSTWGDAEWVFETFARDFAKGKR